MTVIRLRTGDTEALFSDGDHVPVVVHLGAPLEDSIHDSLFGRLVPPGGLDAPPPPSLVTEPARGWFGEPGIAVSRGGRTLAPLLTRRAVESDGTRLAVTLEDDQCAVRLVVTARLDPAGGLVLGATVTNLGPDPLGVDALALTVPVPDRCTELVSWGGRHAFEFAEERRDWGRSVVTLASRRGRTSHQQPPLVVAGESGFGENHGLAWGVHLAWSGDHRLTCDAVTADRRTITAGVPLSVGEVVLARNESHDMPEVLVAWSDTGFSGVTARFHSLLRTAAPHGDRPRPVIANTWEAVYFDHDRERIFELARRAAAAGAERFLLDDGWFPGRRDDTAGLGDWRVDPAVWSEGLGPLITHVRSLGMDFGIWVEPEMVNPDSDLYRAHPDWVLGDARQHGILGRHQLVLDLGRPEVRDHLHAALDALLRDHDIAHVKWDHNRDVVSTGSTARTRGFLDLLGRLRAAHPLVTFEGCASGGGRIDAGISSLVSRHWTSDCIDALDRLVIQKGALRLVPPEMLGAHIGAPTSHTTGRRHPLSFRALSALPFWMGIEWNLLAADERELARLAEVVAVHKQHRELLHRGITRFGDHPDPTIHLHAVVAPDAGEALVVVAATASGPRHDPGNLCIPGLDPARRYRVTHVPLGTPRWALHRGLPAWLSGPIEASGRHLADVGLPCPPLLPASGLLLRLEAVG